MPPDGTSPSTGSVVAPTLSTSQVEQPEVIPSTTMEQEIKTPADSALINKPTTNDLKTIGNEQEIKEIDPRLQDVHSDYFPPLEIVWRNVGLFVYLHVAAAIGLYLLLTGNVQWRTMVWTLLIHCCGALGITAGAHRLWSHKSYKATLPLRIILTFMQTVSFQNSVHEWSRDHRVHHKYSETHADPHNAKRGFFFAHMGWLVCRKHPLVKEKGKAIDMSDLEADPVLMFQKKYYLPLVLTCSFIIPSVVPWYFWGESFITCWCFAAQFRYCLNLHCTWLVNSAAHLWGDHPYDKTINPAENKSVAFFAFGEGWHNYHHTFPWDYKTAEVGAYQYNFTAAFVDFFAWVGWAYDLKTVSEKVIADRIRRTGDGSHASLHSHHDHDNSAGGGITTGPWGWGDADIPKEDMEVTEVLYPLIDLKED